MSGPEHTRDKGRRAGDGAGAGGEGASPLARRLMELEESHTFLSRTLDELSGEVLTLGNTLRDLARRVDRMDDRLRGLDHRDGADASDPSGSGGLDDFGAGPDGQA